MVMILLIYKCMIYCIRKVAKTFKLKEITMEAWMAFVSIIAIVAIILTSILCSFNSIANPNEQKIIDACNKAARRAMVELSSSDYQVICNAVWDKLVENDMEETEIYEMHNIVESVLEECFPSRIDSCTTRINQPVVIVILQAIPTSTIGCRKKSIS